MHRKLLGVVFFLALSITFFNTETYAEGQIKVTLDEYPLTFSVEPRIINNGYTVVPFRKLAESINVNVVWNAKQRSITANGNGQNVLLKIDSNEAMINGVPYKLQAPPFIDDGHTLIPLRFFMEAFNAGVKWDGQTQTISISSPKTDMYTMAFYGLGSFPNYNLIPFFDSTVFGWSSISKGGEWITNRSYKGDLYDYYWPRNADDISTADLISMSGNEGDAYFMVHGGTLANIKTFLASDNLDEKIDEMVHFVKEKEFNGILIDFEGFRDNEENKPVIDSYTKFLLNLKNKAQKQQLKIAVAIAPPNNAFNGYDYKAIGNIADVVFLMAYDYNDRSVQYSPEPLSKVEEGIILSLNSIPKEKLVLGINMAYENNTSVGAKIGLAKRYHLKGTGYWLLKYFNNAKVQSVSKTINLRK